MSDDASSGGLHIDSDWKTEAAQEKQRLADQEAKESKKKGGAGTAGEPPASFVELVNLLAVQAAVGLGGYQGPGGERIPPNAAAAKHHIDLLEVLESKTKGNLDDEERQILGAVLHELRMQYVQAVTPHPPASDPEKQ